MLLLKAGKLSNPSLHPSNRHRISYVVLMNASLDPKDAENICFSGKWIASPEDP